MISKRGQYLEMQKGGSTVLDSAYWQDLTVIRRSPTTSRLIGMICSGQYKGDTFRHIPRDEAQVVIDAIDEVRSIVARNCKICQLKRTSTHVAE